MSTLVATESDLLAFDRESYFVFATATGGDDAEPDQRAGAGAAAAAVQAPADEPQENGSSVTAARLTPSGNQAIDGILSPNKWAGTAITYSNPDSVSDYQPNYRQQLLAGFEELTPAQLLGVHFALNQQAETQPAAAGGFSIEALTGLTIGYAGDGSGAGTIRAANSDYPGWAAFAVYPINDPVGGDIFYGFGGSAPAPGNTHWLTILHEIGHAIGLEHGHGDSPNGALPANVDSIEFSVMTYRSYIGDEPNIGWSHQFQSSPHTYMMLDIAALQYMYGADYSANAGDTTYTWTPRGGDTLINGQLAIDANQVIFLTVWDGSGNDTYDLSAYTTDLAIDLRPGEHSNFGTQLANLGGGPNGGFARGNVFNALLFENNTASLIENAIGGSGSDTFTGNTAANRFIGNGGDDYFRGDAGDDTFLGGDGDDDGNAGPDRDVAWLGPGADRLYGWTGDDEIYGEAGTDALIGDAGGDTLDGGLDNDRLYGGSGDDYLIGGGGADFIDGSGGNDIIAGGDGNDRLQGRSGADRYDFVVGSDADRIYGFEDDLDTLYLDSAFGFASATEVLRQARASGDNLFIDLGDGDTITLIRFMVDHTAADLRDDIVIF